MGQSGICIDHQRLESKSIYSHRRMTKSRAFREISICLCGWNLPQRQLGAYENVSILVAIGVDEDGYREVLAAAEGMKEDG